MAVQIAFVFQSPDSTALLNQRLAGLINKGIYSGGVLTPAGALTAQRIDQPGEPAAVLKLLEVDAIGNRRLGRRDRCTHSHQPQGQDRTTTRYANRQHDRFLPQWKD